MPPKQKDEPKKQQIDKTFGMKNKKGNKNQQMIAQTKRNQGGGTDYDKEAKAKKDAAAKALDMVLFTEAKKKNEIRRAAEEACKAKQKEKEPDKRNIYEDTREAKEKDTMEGWDLEKLNSVVEKKGGGGERVKTDIVCKHFLDAIETKRYGWFWECPNGGDKCQYRHCLPAGYVLKSEIKEQETQEGSLEDEIEAKRKALTSRTPVTLDRLQEWLKAKKEKRAAEEAEKIEVAKKEYAKGKRPVISGRALFAIDPSLFVDDEGAQAGEMERDVSDDDDDDEPINQVDLTPMAAPPPPEPAPAADLDGVDESAFAEEEEEEEDSEGEGEGDGAGDGAGAGGSEGQQQAAAASGRGGDSAKDGEKGGEKGGAGAASTAPAAAPDLEGVDESLFLVEDFDDADIPDE